VGRTFLLSLLLIILAVTANADMASLETAAPGPKQYNGVNGIARIIPQGSYNISSSDKMSYGFGATMDVGAPHGNIVTESGLLYRHFGTNLINGNLRATFDAGYVSIPLLLKVYTGQQRPASLYFKGGIIPGFLADSTSSSSSSGTLLNKFDLELALGLGGRFRISEANDLFIEATYNRGLTNVIDTGSSPSSPTYNAAILLTGGLGFNL
jgi:hypothetical protein